MDLDVALSAAGSIYPVRKPAKMPDDLECGFRGEVGEFLTYEPASS